MGYTNLTLKDKIVEMYPEITKHDISLSLDFSKEKKTYIIKLKKGKHELTTHLEKKDADECMDGIKCIHLGIHLSEFIENFMEGEVLPGKNETTEDTGG